jgi:hypothetical protein
VTIGRRDFVKSGVMIVASATALPVRAASRSEMHLIVFDSRIAKSVAFANATSLRTIDVARMDDESWRSFRAPLGTGTIAGLTRWSDLVIVRGYAEEQGKRLIRERRQGQLFAWQIG